MRATAMVVGGLAASIAGTTWSVLSPARAQGFGWGTMGGYGPGWGMMNGWGWSGWFGALYMFLWLLVLLAIIAGVVWLIRWGTSRDESLRPPAQRSAGLDILEERYARGEINREEYLQRKRDITS